MAIVKTWEVNTMERDLSDGYITKIIWRCKAIDDSDDTEKPDSRQTGEVSFTKPKSLPSGFKAYDSLDASTCIGWVKTALGSDGVASVETAIDNALAPATTGIGKPWS
tara:strand:- start:1523 stop:1846 length:324 start_codon:yes stop_codon:yes gene_type:complete